jgi:ABC-type multidrug transport system fused ATPase/permease subunit
MKKGTLPRLMATLRPEWFRLTLVTLFGVLSVGSLASEPAILGRAINILFDGIISSRLPAGMTKAEVVAVLRARGEGTFADVVGAMNVSPGTGVNLAGFGRVLGLAAVIYLVYAVLGWAQGYLMTGVAQRAMFGLRRACEEKLARIPLKYFDSHPHGDTLSRVTNDIDNLDTTFQDGLSQLLNSVLMIIGVVGMMFWISPLLAVASLVIIPLGMVVTLLIIRRSQALFIAEWTQIGRLNGLVEETHAGHALVQVFGRRQPMIAEFGRQNGRLYEVTFRAALLSGVILPAVQLLGNLNYVFVAALGGYQVATGVISLGSVQAFIMYSRLFTSPVTQIASELNQLQSGAASAARVFEFLDVPEEILPRPQIPAAGSQIAGSQIASSQIGGSRIGAAQIGAGPPARGVRLEHVSFRYDPGTPLIEDFTLDAAPGQTVAIVGPTGAGKTTIVNLLMRFYEIAGGRILLDGTDYRELGRDQVRACFGMVLQDTWLFTGTIRDNIAYGREGATDEEIIAAARAACVDHFVRTLPGGYATILDGDASGISSGQRQLLTIARVFLANPGILILDEATSNVDTRTEILIQDAMARLRSGRTSFVIAHRLSTIRDADTIVVMDSGRIVEQGSHEDLLHRRGHYHALYNSQFTEALTS